MFGRLNAAGRCVALTAIVSVAAIGWVTTNASLSAQGQLITCPTGFGPVVVPAGAPAFVPLASLKTVPNPVLPRAANGALTIRADLTGYVADLPSAIQLGKALFWDMQAGSDNKTACATCHFHAGADSRDRNQVHPSADKAWNSQWANYSFIPEGADFPIAGDNAAASQGVRKAVFKGIGAKGSESTASVSDPVFSVNGVNVRQATKVNAPSAINAVFNHRNFHNGRAQSEFNGVNPFGPRDGSARVWMLDAKGTPVSDRHPHPERQPRLAGGRSAAERDRDVRRRTRRSPTSARKLLALKPLGLQRVAFDDSVLGPIADTTVGLKVSYAALIQKAFQPKWWNSKKSVPVNGRTVLDDRGELLVVLGPVPDALPGDAGLGRLADGPVRGDAGVRREPAAEQPQPGAGRPGRGAVGIGGHRGYARGHPERAGPVRAPSRADGGRPLPAAAPSRHRRRLRVLSPRRGDDQRVGEKPRRWGHRSRRRRVQERRVRLEDGTDVHVRASRPGRHDQRLLRRLDAHRHVDRRRRGRASCVYDSGWYNIGVRPTSEDLGVGDTDPFGNSLSWTGLFQASANPGVIKVPGGGLGCSSTPPAAPATSLFAGEVLDPLTGFPAALRARCSKTTVPTWRAASRPRRCATSSSPDPTSTPAARRPWPGDRTLRRRRAVSRTTTLSPLIRPLGLTPQQSAGPGRVPARAHRRTRPVAEGPVRPPAIVRSQRRRSGGHRCDGGDSGRRRRRLDVAARGDSCSSTRSVDDGAGRVRPGRHDQAASFGFRTGETSWTDSNSS